MRKVMIFLLLSGFAVAEKPATYCTLKFAVVVKDEFGNFNQGLGPKTTKWVENKLAKKYSGICYSKSAQPLVFFFSSTPATFHGVQNYSDTSISSSPMSGTVTDGSIGSTTYGQQVGTISGTMQTTTTTEHSVPYEFDYQKLYLSIEQKRADGTWEVMRNFGNSGLCPTLAGFCVSNRHPAQTMLENAIKWLHSGGLTDPMQRIP